MDPERPSSPAHGSNKPAPTSALGNAVAFAGVGLQFALSIVVCVFVGQWIDRKAGTSPLFIVIGAFAGAAAGFYVIYRRLMDDQKRREEEAGRS